MRTQETTRAIHFNGIDYTMVYWHDDGEDEDDDDNEPGWYGYLWWSTRQGIYGMGDIGPFETVAAIEQELLGCAHSFGSPRKRENKRFDLDLIDIRLINTNPDGRWEFDREPISGIIYEYSVTDRNFRSPNRWTFVIRVPSRLVGKTYVEVRPTPQHPQKEYWANIDRQSISFRRATKGKYRGLMYVKLFLAGVADARNKSIARRGERAFLPEYFDSFRLRLKKTVTTTKGTDSKHYVALVKRDDHLGMIRLFFALKVWVQYSGFVVRR